MRYTVFQTFYFLNSDYGTFYEAERQGELGKNNTLRFKLTKFAWMRYTVCLPFFWEDAPEWIASQNIINLWTIFPFAFCSTVVLTLGESAKVVTLGCLDKILKRAVNLARTAVSAYRVLPTDVLAVVSVAPLQCVWPYSLQTEQTVLCPPTFVCNCYKFEIPRAQVLQFLSISDALRRNWFESCEKRLVASSCDCWEQPIMYTLWSGTLVVNIHLPIILHDARRLVVPSNCPLQKTQVLRQSPCHASLRQEHSTWISYNWQVFCQFETIRLPACCWVCCWFWESS